MQFTLAIQGILEMELRNIEKEVYFVAGMRRITAQGGET
jgi:hypothetical protein